MDRFYKQTVFLFCLGANKKKVKSKAGNVDGEQAMWTVLGKSTGAVAWTELKDKPASQHLLIALPSDQVKFNRQCD